jgi:hypothetical protein
VGGSVGDGVVRDVKLSRGDDGCPELAVVSIGQTLGMTRYPMEFPCVQQSPKSAINSLALTVKLRHCTAKARGTGAWLLRLMSAG